MGASGWDAAVVRSRPVIPFDGTAWRAHRRQNDGTDWRGSLYASGRYHRSPVEFSPEEAWPALYLGTSYGVCLAEINRHLTPTLFPQLRSYRFSTIRLVLSRVIDCRDLDALQLTAAALFHDLDYRPGQELAAGVRAAGGEGLLIPSASRFPDDVLVVFPDRLDAQSSMTVIEVVDPVLYVPRPGE